MRPASGASACVATFACDRESQPEHAAHLSRALVDTVGCALASATSPLHALLCRWCARELTAGQSTVWTTGDQVSAAQAALLNGTAAHALDWDDVSPGSALHPSTVLLPALLAEAEAAGLTGQALTEAYDVGAAAFRAIAQALPRVEHYERGWHTTSTVGRLAAVAALANLRRLDQRSTQHALGLVASLAAGSLANFGTMTKPLHAGVAARDAVTAVGLAADGFTANPDQLEAVGGFFALFGDPDARRLSRLPADLARWRTDWPHDWALKRYPACYATHRALDAALRLRQHLGGSLPVRIEVVVEPGGLRPLITHEPSTPAEARFSMAYALSAAFVHGDVRLEHFTGEALQDTRVSSLMGAVIALESPLPPSGVPDYGDGYAVVSVTSSSGALEQCRVDTTYGDSRLPLSDADLDAKFADCCREGGLSPAAGRRLAALLRALPSSHDASPLRDALREPRSSP